MEFKQLDYGVNIKDRLVIFEEHVTISTPIIIRERIRTVAAISNDYESPINLFIASYGGDVHGMFGVLDILRQMPMPIYTTGIGAVMSAAVFVLAAGQKGHRKVGKHTRMMIHQMSTLVAGTSGDILNEADYIKALQTAMNASLAANSNKDIDYWADRTTRNLYLTPELCLEHGLVDEII